jgi:hypothetical protein
MHSSSGTKTRQFPPKCTIPNEFNLSKNNNWYSRTTQFGNDRVQPAQVPKPAMLSKPRRKKTSAPNNKSSATAPETSAAPVDLTGTSVEEKEHDHHVSSTSFAEESSSIRIKQLEATVASLEGELAQRDQEIDGLLRQIKLIEDAKMNRPATEAPRSKWFR